MVPLEVDIVVQIQGVNEGMFWGSDQVHTWGTDRVSSPSLKQDFTVKLLFNQNQILSAYNLIMTKIILF